MQGIPPVKDTDAEDVVWGLQTAASLWKRGERIDALVWLRRAAQAAGEASDDDRALELARHAAELSDWMATLPPGAMSEVPPAHPRPSTDTAQTYAPNAPTHAPMGADSEPRSIDIPVDIESVPTAPPTARPVFPPPPPRPRPPESRPPSQPTMQTAEPTFDPQHPPESQEENHAASVPPAEKVHAGMFNPWDEAAGAMTPRSVPVPPARVQPVSHVPTPHPPTPLPPTPPPPSAPPPTPPPPARATGRSAPPRFREEEEVVTSVRPQAAKDSRPAGPSVPRPPPLPPRAKAPKPPLAPRAPASGTKIQAAPPASAGELDAAPPVTRPSEPEPPPAPPPVTDAERGYVTHDPSEVPPAPMTPVPPSPTQQMDVGDQERLRKASLPPGMDMRPAARTESDADVDADERVPSTKEPTGDEPAPASVLELDGVEAFADLPDDARAAFAAAATTSRLAEGDEVSNFALAYVLSGSVDVSATMVDAAAGSIGAGAVLRSRGTTDEGVPMRLVSARGEAVVATWTDAAVEEAFRTCPWVEDDLRAAADRVQTLVGITIGPLGERLDVSIREQIVGRLTMRTLLAGEVIVTEGEVVPGLLLVGVGEIELVQGDVVKSAIGSGDFVFPGEVLGAGNAPATARAGAGGALILFGDRKIAQELLVTCPPLLEVFAGM